MKKLLIFLLCGVMLLSLAACRGDKDEQEGSVPHEEGDVYVSYANQAPRHPSGQRRRRLYVHGGSV